MTEHRVEYDTGQHARIVQDTGEPLDRLSARDINLLRDALNLYYTEMAAHGEERKKLHTGALSVRLADVSRTWIAEEASS